MTEDQLPDTISAAPYQAGMIPKTGWYDVSVPDLGVVWLIRHEPDPSDYEDLGGPGPFILWGEDEADDPEAIEVNGIEADELRWMPATEPDRPKRADVLEGR